MLVAAAFSLALPTFWISLSLGLCVLFWALSGHFHLKWQRVRAHPAAWAAVALFALYGLGTLYSPVPSEVSLAFWGKYHKLLYIPLVISLLDDDVWRQRAADAFFWGMLLVLAISYLNWLGWYPQRGWYLHLKDFSGQGYSVFKGRIAQNLFMAFTAYLALDRAYRDVPRRWLWAGVALLATANVMFLVNGRTGQLVLPVLALWFMWKHLSRRVTLVTGITLVMAFALQSLHGDSQQTRMFQIGHEIQAYDPKGSNQSSSGQRLEFYQNTLAITLKHPWFGWGTGSFSAAYTEFARNNKFANTLVTNPHNEYLLTAQQLGLAGLAMLIFMGWRHWRTGQEIHGPEGQHLRALILVIGIGALFNSLLLDASEGKFYCLMAGIYLSAWRSKAVQGPAARTHNPAI
ncbi:MAG: O-antigen ligase domain-containing protein [Nitrosomonadales bacterium]|nr:MAG: O-antigen ligase domain-containing protein [Nitrosomonadales bacterium]